MSKFIQFNDENKRIVDLDKVSATWNWRTLGEYEYLTILASTGEQDKVELCYGKDNDSTERRNKDSKRLLRALNVRAKEREILKWPEKKLRLKRH